MGALWTHPSTRSAGFCRGAPPALQTTLQSAVVSPQQHEQQEDDVTPSFRRSTDEPGKAYRYLPRPSTWYVTSGGNRAGLQILLVSPWQESQEYAGVASNWPCHSDHITPWAIPWCPVLIFNGTVTAQASQGLFKV